VFAKEAKLVFEALKTAAPPPGPTAETTLATLARAARVADRVGAGLGVTDGPGATMSRWVGRALRLTAGLIDLALPHTVRSLVSRHLLDVAIVAAVLMILLGGVIAGPSVSAFGWTVLFVALAVKIVLELLDRWLDHPGWLFVTVIVGVVLVAFTAYGAFYSDGWPPVVVLLMTGAALGLGFAASISGSGSGGRLVIGALAVLLVLLSSIIGIRTMRTDVTQTLCTDHPGAWYTDAVVAVLVDSCPTA
jgi:hypothetical protein